MLNGFLDLGVSKPRPNKAFAFELLYMLKPVFDSEWLPDSAQVNTTLTNSFHREVHALAPPLLSASPLAYSQVPRLRRTTSPRTR